MPARVFQASGAACPPYLENARHTNICSWALAFKCRDQPCNRHSQEHGGLTPRRSPSVHFQTCHFARELGLARSAQVHIWHRQSNLCCSSQEVCVQKSVKRLVAGRIPLGKWCQHRFDRGLTLQAGVGFVECSTGGRICRPGRGGPRRYGLDLHIIPPDDHFLSRSFPVCCCGEVTIPLK